MVCKASSSLLASCRACSHASKNYHMQRPTQGQFSSKAMTDAAKSLRAAVLLNRSPTLTRTLTPFEAAHYEYNARIARALFNPFPVDFYFKAGSVLEKKFMREESEREKKAFRWDGHVPESSQKTEDEGDGNSSDVSVGILGKEEEVAIMPRLREADRRHDVRSLDRKGERNLYLLVKKGKGRNEWRLPGGVSEIQEGELLHETAKRDLHAECGMNMDVWIVGRHPIGFMDSPIPPDIPPSKLAGVKTFYFKGHILAGQVDPSAGSLADFAWLTKREVKRAVSPEYWATIQDILSDV